jgi:CheY-like chemotaxis protein
MKNILVVDDNKCIRDLVALIVTTFLKDCSVHMAENGAKAVRIFDSLPMSAIVTDLSMPVMDGYQFIKHVRSRSSDIPIIAMTGDSGPDIDERLKLFGVKRCLEKPFDVRDAAEEIASALGSAYLAVA